MRPDHAQRSAITLADSPFCQEPDSGYEPFLRSMAESDIGSVVHLITRAMNVDEGKQALETFGSHFSCKHHGINDGRSYYVLAEDSVARGVVGLHQYLWAPPENVWLAWFAVDPALHGRGRGAFLLDAITHKAKQLKYMKFFIETYSTPEFARAREFYRAKGFAQVGRVQSYLSNGGDMVVFSKDLTNDV